MASQPHSIHRSVQSSGPNPGSRSHETDIHPPSPPSPSQATCKHFPVSRICATVPLCWSTATKVATEMANAHSIGGLTMCPNHLSLSGRKQPCMNARSIAGGGIEDPQADGALYRSTPGIVSIINSSQSISIACVRGAGSDTQTIHGIIVPGAIRRDQVFELNMTFGYVWCCLLHGCRLVISQHFRHSVK